jgi:transposase
LIPHVAKTWSPQGCTPVHYHRQRRRDKVSVISGISVSPKQQRLGLYYQLYFDNIGQEEVCLFLRGLLRHLRGPVIVLLDNSSTHQGQRLQQLLRQYSRLHIEHFPSYAPELNPDEGVWSLAKPAPVGCAGRHSMGALRGLLRERAERWTASSAPSSSASTWNGKPACSGFLHKRLNSPALLPS